MVRYKNDVNNKHEVHDNFTEELIKYQNVSLDEIVKFGVNRFNLYKKMKYNVLALEVWNTADFNHMYMKLFWKYISANIAAIDVDKSNWPIAELETNANNWYSSLCKWNTTF